MGIKEFQFVAKNFIPIKWAASNTYTSRKQIYFRVSVLAYL